MRRLLLPRVAIATILLLSVGTALAAPPPPSWSTTSRITVSYDPSLEQVMDGLYLGDAVDTIALDLFSSTSGAAAAAAVTGVNFHISPFITPPSLTPDIFTVKPLALASLCIANTQASSSGSSAAQIGTALTVPSATVQWYVAPPSVSPASALLLRTLVLNSVAGFTSATAWPTAVLKNPRVVMMVNDAAISSALLNCSLQAASTVSCIGPQLSFAPWAAPVQCTRVKKTSNYSGDSSSYAPRLTAASASSTIVLPANGTVYAIGNVYPFVGGLLISVRRSLPCDLAHLITQALITFFVNSTNSAALDSLGLQAIQDSRNFETLNLLTTTLTTNCTADNGLLPLRFGGDGGLYDAVAALSFDRSNTAAAAATAPVLVGFDRGTTDAVLGALYAPGSTVHAALVEGTPNSTVRAMRPSVTVAPIFAHGVAIVYNLDRRDGLAASPCTLLGILNGSITYWDDPAIKANNVGVQLAHTKITRVINMDSSLEAIGRGVSYLARRCGVKLNSSYTSFPFGSDMAGVSSTGVVPTVQVVQGAIGLAPVSSAVAASIQQLSILFGSHVTKAQDRLAATVAQSTFDVTTSTFTFPPTRVDYYPFVAIAFAAFDTDARGACDAYRGEVDWLRRAVSTDAASVLVTAQQVLLPTAMAATAQNLLMTVKCDGVALYPTPVSELEWWPYAVIVGACLLLVSGFVGRLAYRWWLQSARPTDSSKAIAVMFVGIQNQAAVLEAGEENAAAVHRYMADTVRRLVRKHRCHEARRIDAATTMIVGKSAEATVACAEEIVLALSNEDLWLQSVMTYPMPQQVSNGRKPKHLDSRRSDMSCHSNSSSVAGGGSGLPPAHPNSGRVLHPAMMTTQHSATKKPLPMSESPRTPKQPTSARHRQSPSPPSTPLSKRASSYAIKRSAAAQESPRDAAPPSKKASSTEMRSQITGTGTQHTGASNSTIMTLQQCVPEVYAGIHWTHVVIDVDETLDTVTYMGAGIAAAASVADLAVGGQVTVSRVMMDVLQTDYDETSTSQSQCSEYCFTPIAVGNADRNKAAPSDDSLAVLSLTTPRFPESLIAAATMRRKLREEKEENGTASTSLIAAAMASADGSLARRRIAAVSLLLRDLVRESADGRATVAAEALQDLQEIVTANRGQIHSISDGVVTVTVGANAPVAMAAMRAAQIAMDAADMCISAGVHCGAAMVGNAAGGRPATTGRVLTGAMLMRLVAARANVAVVVSDAAHADLTTKFEMATVDFVATPWEPSKHHLRCYAVVEERVQAEEGEWLYDLGDGFATLERRFDWALHKGPSTGSESTTTVPAAPPLEQNLAASCNSQGRTQDSTALQRLSDEIFAGVLAADGDARYLQDYYLSRSSSLGSFALTGGGGRTPVL